MHSGGGSSVLPGVDGSSLWKVHVRPSDPFPQTPFLLSCSPSSSLYSLRGRIAKVLSRYESVHEEHIMLFVTVEGTNYALIEDGPLCDLIENGEKLV
jgi:hypothetical protein